MVGRDAAESIKIITRAASERIARFAFEYAVANGRHKVTAVHKANIMKLSDGLFLESCRTIAAEYDGRIEFEDRIVDNMCMQLVQKPELYDVLVLPNLYGDIVSDLCAGLVGGLGVAPGANIGTEAAVFEPVHGSAPKYAGLDRANPTAMILSGALMLRHLGYPEEADRLETAVRDVIAEGDGDHLRPRRHRPGRAAFADAIIERLGADHRVPRPDDRDCPPASASRASRPAPPARASARPAAVDRLGDRRRSSRASVFTICVHVYPVLGGILLVRRCSASAYEVDGYLSPLFSPLDPPGLAAHVVLSPAILILWIPLGFRATCYYYRKAYYRFYFADPPGCAVGEPTVHRRYRMETAFPFILQNLHRFFLYLAFVPLFFLWLDAILSLQFDGQVADRARGRSSCGFNALLLTGYSLSCHSLRHLVGGKLDCFSCTPATPGPLHAVAAADVAQPAPHGVGLGEPDLGHAGRPVHPAAGDRGHHRPGDPLLASGPMALAAADQAADPSRTTSSSSAPAGPGCARRSRPRRPARTSGSCASRCSARPTRSWPRAASPRRCGHVAAADSWQIHFRDTMVGGKLLNNPRMAQLHAHGGAGPGPRARAVGRRLRPDRATGGSCSGRSVATRTRASPTSATGPASR